MSVYFFNIHPRGYETEQKELSILANELERTHENSKSKADDVQRFIEQARKYTHIKELTPTIVNEFISRIEVSQKQVIDGKKVYPIDVYYNGVGIGNMPSAEEMEELFQDHIRSKEQETEKTA
ncbi:MAG: DUF4368 domain-containing protein [Clostridiales bacterium]|nr:DUF4368 domain-containing protein [Clostridiales bacterium]